MKEIAYRNLNFNTVLLGVLSVIGALLVKKVDKTFDSVTRFEVQIQSLTERVGRTEDRIDRIVEAADGIPSDRRARSPKDISNHP